MSSNQHRAVCIPQAQVLVEAEQKQPVFNLFTNLLFLTTWEGGDNIDKASESFRTESQL